MDELALRSSGTEDVIRRLRDESAARLERERRRGAVRGLAIGLALGTSLLGFGTIQSSRCLVKEPVVQMVDPEVAAQAELEASLAALQQDLDDNLVAEPSEEEVAWITAEHGSDAADWQLYER
jgi:hypothetical protein